MRDAANARQSAGCAIWVCWCKTGKVQTWREERQGANACCLGGKLLIDQAFSFVFGLLLFLLLSLAATVTRVEGSVALGGFLTDVVAVFRILGVARSWPCPEACYAVVRAGGEDVAKRVPVKGPDSEVVSVLDTVGWVYGLRGRVLRVGGIVWG